MRYKLTIAYDGTHYCGWQVQANSQSIQSLIQQALQTALRHPLNLTGSGRTDAGVHARGQTAHFDTEVPLDPHRFRLSLNALLPHDIRILQIDPVPDLFHARYSAKRKIYHYHLHLDSIADPFARLYRTQIFSRLDLSLLKEATRLFLGTHDFISFANQKKTVPDDTIRTLYRLDAIDQPGGIRLEFEGDGFLYKMVRNITGTLLDIATHKLALSEIPAILASRDRKKAGQAAPPQGLFLMQVIY